jgi:autotransporter passenger strand-loop-strand repeat protein
VARRAIRCAAPMLALQSAGIGVANGVTMVVSSAGLAIDTTISSGGREVVSSGGELGNATLAGGTLEITSGAMLGSAAIDFTSSGGVVRLDDATSFGAAISGFGIRGGIGLVNVAYNSATTPLNFQEAVSTLSGTLTVNDGTHVATLTLLGQYVTGQFHMAIDGNGGTLVTDPPVDSAGHLTSPH